MANDSKQIDFFDRVQLITEKFLTHRAKVRHIKTEKRKAKPVALDWLEAFIWAAGMVLLINQYGVQAYRIPSGSMIDTLNIGDQIFVNKLVYGPELLPGFLKLPSPIQPKRSNIIIFENPSYISRGVVFDIAQRIIYMLTLSLVDIDKDQAGETRVHFLIKREIGQAGDHLVLENGNIKIMFAGEDRWIEESDYNAQRGWNHHVTRSISQEQYPAIKAYGKSQGWINRGMSPSEQLLQSAKQTEEMQSFDGFARERSRLETMRKSAPHDIRYSELLAQSRLGWYIPEGRFFPMGDNRDFSKDARFFGPVKVSRVLGKGMFIYWPFWRMGKII
ncbi:MAG: S26 family signal peptidase [Treponema sp.]|jgi:signal peptidase I|nr:S26 family signal peptidase [Treponema sp.]